MIRTGKIARLPRNIREQLNRRLENGELGIRLIQWLNSLPGVQKILEEQFGGRPINKVNLRHWRQGGFLDWQTRRQEIRLRLLSGSGLAGTAVKVNTTAFGRRLGRKATRLSPVKPECPAGIRPS